MSKQTPKPSEDGLDACQEVLRVLIVDDDQVDRRHFRRICKKAGLLARIGEARTIREMRQKLDETVFDIVFLDHNLGADTGIEALRVLQAHEEQAGAVSIMLTNMSGHHNAAEAMRNGCADYLYKSELSEETLRRTVLSAMQRRKIYSAIAEFRQENRRITSAIQSVKDACGPEVKASLVAMQEFLNQGEAGTPPALENSDAVMHLDRACRDLLALSETLEAFGKLDTPVH